MTVEHLILILLTILVISLLFDRRWRNEVIKKHKKTITEQGLLIEIYRDKEYAEACEAEYLERKEQEEIFKSYVENNDG